MRPNCRSRSTPCGERSDHSTGSSFWLGVAGGRRPLRPIRSRLRRLAAGRGAGRPGDRYDTTTDWAEILEPHGWGLAYESADGVRHWTRPGKDSGTLATTGYDPEGSGRDLLYVFTTAAPPFDPGRADRKFTAFALLEHGGDFRAAARTLMTHSVYIPRSLLRSSVRGSR